MVAGLGAPRRRRSRGHLRPATRLRDDARGVCVVRKIVPRAYGLTRFIESANPEDSVDRLGECISELIDNNSNRFIFNGELRVSADLVRSR